MIKWIIMMIVDNDRNEYDLDGEQNEDHGDHDDSFDLITKSL